MKTFAKRLLALSLCLAMMLGMFVVTSSAATASVPSGASVVGHTYSDDTLSTVKDPLAYAVGDDIVFGFRLKSDSTYYTAPYLYYKVQRDDGVTESDWVAFNEDGVAVVKTKMTCAGFAYITAYPVESDGSTTNMISASFNGSAGADVTDVKTVYARPEGFESYWESVLSQLTTSGCEIEYIYDLSDKVSGYYLYEIQVSCPEDEYYGAKLHRNSWGTVYETSRPEDNHVSLWLSIPKSASSSNKLPITIAYTGHDWTLPGLYSGSSSYDYVGLCASNAIKLSVSAHSIPMPHNASSDADSADLTDGIYNAHYYYTTLKNQYGYTDWHGSEYDATKDNNYFKYMLMRDVQAVKFATKFFGEGGTLSSEVGTTDVSAWAGLWNSTDISVSGASQGGYQSVAVAALCPEVTSFSAGVPWFADESVKSADSLRMKPTSPRAFAYVDGLRYVDIANLATLIDSSCNGTITMGLGDTLCPPSTIFSAYNNMNCNVTVTAYQNAGHSASDKGSGNGTISKTATSESKEYDLFVNSSAVTYTDASIALFKTKLEALTGYELTLKSSASSLNELKNSLVITALTGNETDSYDTFYLYMNAESSYSKAFGIMICNDEPYKVTNSTAAAYALSNDPSSNVFVFSNDCAAITEDNAEALAYSYAACLGGGNMPTPDDGRIVMCDENGVLDSTFSISSGESSEKLVAVITSPVWAAQQGIRTETKNAELNGGKLSIDTSVVGDGVSASVTVKTNRYSASYTVSEPITNTYPCGDDLRMELGSSGTLYIRGTGTAFKPLDADGNFVDVNWDSNASGKEWSLMNYYGIKDQVKKIIFEAPITSIKGYALDCFDKCTTIELPTSYVNASGEIFHGMNSLTTVYTTGQTPQTNVVNFSNISSVGGWTFVYAPIKKVILGKNLKTLGQKDVFYACTQLAEVTLPKGLTSIPAHTFYNCTSLTTIEIPYGCAVADTAFEGCKNITTVTVNNDSATASTAWLDKLTGLTSIKCIEGSSADTWAKAKGWTEGNEITYITPDVDTNGTVTVSSWNVEQTWSYDNSTKTLTLGGSSYDYDLSAFAKDASYNSFLKFYGDKVKTIVVNATSGKLWYTFASLGLTEVTRIEVKQGRYHDQSTALLSGMSKLTTFGMIGSIKENVIDYSFVSSVYPANPTGWFKGCAAATEIILPSSAVALNERNDTNPTYAYIPADTFNGCTSLKTVTIPAYATSIGKDAFKDCTSLTKITVPDTVTSIDDTAFDGCTLTMYGTSGSAAETFASSHANITFATSGSTVIPGDDDDYIVKDKLIGVDGNGNKLYYRIETDDSDSTAYVMTVYGSGTTCYPYDSDGNKVSATGYSDSTKEEFKTRSYLNIDGVSPSKIKTLRFENTSEITTTGAYMFQGLGITTIEFSSAMTKLCGDWLNGIEKVETVYTTGHTAVSGRLDFSAFTDIGNYNFYQNKATSVIVGDGVTYIGAYTLASSDNKLLYVEIPESVTTIHADAFRSQTLFTIVGKKGSYAQTYAETNNIPFIDKSEYSEIIAYGALDTARTKVYMIGKAGDANYTIFLTGTATAFENSYGYNAVTGHPQPWADYISKITKAVIVNKNLTSIDSALASHSALKTVEIPASLKTLKSHAFNGSPITTIYVSGNTPVSGTADLRAVTSIGECGLASLKASKLLFSDDLGDIASTKYFFFKMSSLTYLRLPKNISKIVTDEFSQCDALKTILIEDPDCAITDGAIPSSVKTLIGYPSSTAEKYAASNNLEFVPISSEGLLDFAGFSLRVTGYNGLRSEFHFNKTASESLTGLSVVEYGTLLSSSEKIVSGSDVGVVKDENGKYVISGTSHGVVCKIMENGAYTQYLANCSSFSDDDGDDCYKFFVTIVKYDETTYNKNARFRGYAVLRDADGNEYVVYSDLLDSEGEGYSTQSLKSMVEIQYAAGLIDDENICYVDVKRFGEQGTTPPATSFGDNEVKEDDILG